MNIIDLNNLSEEKIRLLKITSKKLIKDHEELVKNIYLSSDKSIDWVVNSLLSRNNYLSDVFKDICHVFFVKRLIEKENIDIVICQSNTQRDVLNDYFKSKSINVKIVSNETYIDKLKELLSPYLYFYINIKLILSFIFNSKKERFTFFKKHTDITIIDTFFIDTMFNDNKYHDRYYPNLLDNIPNDERKNHFFLPTILINKNLKEKIRIAEKTENQFLFIFDILKLKDYLYALSSPLRIKKINLNNIMFRNMNIGPILKADFKKNISSKSSFLGILNYLLFKALKKEKIKLRLVINWFENQSIDRGFNLGKNKFFPNTLSIGYQGFSGYHDFHSHYIPTLHEYETGQTPNQLAVIGKTIVKKIRKVCPYINVTVSPAFRFKYLYEKSIEPVIKEHNHYNILLTLPSSNIESNKLISFVINNLDVPEFSNIKWLIKSHPNRDINILKKAFSSWPKAFNIVDTSFETAINSSDLMVGNTSSTCMEALAKGKPVIITSNDNFIDQNPIPVDFPKEVWAICSNSNEFRLAIKSLLLNAHLKKQSFQIDYGKKVLEEYFEPITSEGLNTFLNI